MNYVANQHINSPDDLITPHEQIRAGFLSAALEKNRIAGPYIDEAKTFKSSASKLPHGLDDLIKMSKAGGKYREFMLTAAGLSDKALLNLKGHDDDKDKALNDLVENFLRPAGDNYIDEAVYRFLLIKGDSLGGTMRNRVGMLGQERLIRRVISCLNIQDIEYDWLSLDKNSAWNHKSIDDSDIEKHLKALHWSSEKGERVLGFNLKIDYIGYNVDICLFNSTMTDFDAKTYNSNPKMAIMFGELKGGIDPAAADEHWKTARSALDRIKTNCEENGVGDIKTSFVAAVIVGNDATKNRKKTENTESVEENSESVELYNALNNQVANPNFNSKKRTISNGANLLKDDQLVDYCEWILDL